LESTRTLGSRRGSLRSVLTAALAALLALALSSCVADRPPVANIALQREGDDLRIVFCDGVRIDVLWVDQRDGRSHTVWEARPYLTLEPGEIVDRSMLGDSLVETGKFDFESGGPVVVQAAAANGSVEAEFPTKTGVPTDGWLHPDGRVTEAECG